MIKRLLVATLTASRACSHRRQLPRELPQFPHGGRNSSPIEVAAGSHRLFVEDEHRSRDRRRPQAALVTYRALRHVAGAHNLV